MAIEKYFKERIFIIAEAGVNHNGNVDIARKLIDVAKDCGADAVKFQTFLTHQSISKYAGLAQYQRDNLLDGLTQYEMAKKLELSYAHFSELKKHCDEMGIIFLSTPDEAESLNFLCSLGVPLIKVGSGEITNLPFLKLIAKTKKSVILSTGMSNIGEIRRALSVFYKEGNKDIALLHCVTEYPAPAEQVNLNAMFTLKNTFKIPVGYSDHTLGIEIAIAAAAMGAKIIEKHFTLDKSIPGPDHRSSLEPRELKQMICAIRNVEKALGGGIKKIADCEKKNLVAVRKSIVAAKDLTIGQKISERDVAIKKHGSGIAPQYLKKIVGRKTKEPIKEDEVITWEMLK